MKTILHEVHPPLFSPSQAAFLVHISESSYCFTKTHFSSSKMIPNDSDFE